MWYPPQSCVLKGEPVSLDEVKEQCRLDPSYEDGYVLSLQAAVRAHAEEYCNARFALHSIVRQCDDWGDFTRLADAPIRSVTEIKYIDASGAEQVFTDYTVNPDGYEPSITSENWPTIKPGSRITLSADFGGDCPKSVQLAIKHKTAQFFDDRINPEQVITSTNMSAFDTLLSNHRRGAW